MTSGTASGTVMFLGKEFNIKALEQAISKSNETYIEPGKEVHLVMFAQHELPAEWLTKFKKPVVTIHEGKYVIIVTTDAMAECIAVSGTGEQVKSVVAKGFKAKFVTKYNFNQSKVANEVAAVPEPIKEIRPAYQDKAAPQWKPNNGFQKNQSGGYQGNRRDGKY